MRGAAIAGGLSRRDFRRSETIQRMALTGLIALIGVAAAFPLAWMALTSLKTPAETMQTPPVWWPATPSLDAYAKVAGVIDAGRSFLNSAIIASATTIGIVVTSLMAGYAFSKHAFKGRDVLFSIIVATMFLPPIVTLIPLYRMVGSLKLDGSLAGVILPNLANAFGIFLMRQFIAGVPDELIEAARLDGASELRIVFGIVAPNILPAVATLAIFAFCYNWNSYLWPLTILEGNGDSYPIVLSLSRLLSYNRGAINTNLVMAGATLAVLPPLLLFAVLQRAFINSVIQSGLNG
jgi:multiple sugar transport system permease protein